MNTSLQFFSACWLLLALSWPNAHCAAAEPDAVPGWRDGLKLLDSSSQADVTAAQHMLQQAVKQGSVPPEALCTLALLQLRQDKPEAALETIASLANRHTADRQRTAALALRIQLYAALAREEARLADSAFKDLVRSVVSAAGDEVDLRFSAITIGAVVAMLQTDLSQSPISKRDLGIGRDCMLQSAVPGVATAFMSAHDQASERAVELVRQFQLIADKGIELAAAEHAARLEALHLSLAELAEQKELAAEIFRNAREQTEQNTRDRRKLDKLISSLNTQMRRPTPGHPGPQRSAPPLPPPATSIYVNEYEIRTELEYQNQNGELVPVPVTREYRRNPADIEYERDAKYQRVLRDYERVKADYDRYLTAYTQALKTWTEADRARRQKLNEQRADVEAQRAELVAASERIKAEKSAVAQDVVRKRTAREQDEFELELQSIALDAARAQKISTAFRPSHFPVLSWSQEKALLLRNTQ